MKGFGDTTSNAEAMALKRAAAKFGVGACKLYDNNDGTSQALVAHLKSESAPSWASWASSLMSTGLRVSPPSTWLKTQTGAGRNDQIPVWAIRAVMQQLSTPMLVADGGPSHAHPRLPRRVYPPHPGHLPPFSEWHASLARALEAFLDHQQRPWHSVALVPQGRPGAPQEQVSSSPKGEKR